MIGPDHPDKWSGAITFDRFAALVIGLMAILAAALGVIHTARSLEATRAQFEASRLAADVSARISINSLGANLEYQSDEAVLMLRMDGSDRSLAGGGHGSAGAMAVGQAMVDAAQVLETALRATRATSGGEPADPYVASMLAMTDQDFIAVLTEQGHQIDLAQDAGSHDRNAVLGLSVLVLAGVLTGLAAVLREGRAGWIALRSAAGMVALAGVLGVMAMI